MSKRVYEQMILEGKYADGYLKLALWTCGSLYVEIQHQGSHQFVNFEVPPKDVETIKNFLSDDKTAREGQTR